MSVYIAMEMRKLDDKLYTKIYNTGPLHKVRITF